MNNQTELLLAEILKWQKIQGKALLREIIPQLLDTNEKRMVYEMTDGSTPVSEISKKIDVAVGTISNWWKMWLANDIVERVEGKRYRKIISLEDISLLGKEAKSGRQTA